MTTGVTTDFITCNDKSQKELAQPGCGARSVYCSAPLSLQVPDLLVCLPLSLYCLISCMAVINGGERGAYRLGKPCCRTCCLCSWLHSQIYRLAGQWLVGSDASCTLVVSVNICSLLLCLLSLLSLSHTHFPVTPVISLHAVSWADKVTNYKSKECPCRLRVVCT